MVLPRWTMRRPKTGLRFSREVPEEPLSVGVTSSLMRTTSGLCLMQIVFGVLLLVYSFPMYKPHVVEEHACHIGVSASGHG